MAYGLRYTIPQKLRDSSDLVLSIYEDAYVGSPYEYTASSIKIQPNSADEDPIGCIISTQLDVSFVISTESDYSNFPDLLNYNDTKYYVELTINSIVKWRGYLFNDYVDVSFTTGLQIVNMTCIDGLSFLKYNIFSSTDSVNDVMKLLNVIGTALNKLPTSSTKYLYSLCSYYAEGMLNRSNLTSDEPFAQSYQYIRDYVGLDYYTILERIILSFGCRLFQSEGDWYILPMNQMASTLYYTKYVISDAPTISTSGTLNKSVSIEAYSTNAVHFINNDQTKIVRKGYPTIRSIIPFSFAKNYIHNGTFKAVSSGVAVGWTVAQSGSSTVTLTQFSSVQFNRYSIFYLGSGSASISTDANYLPYMYGPNASLAFDFQAANAGQSILVSISLLIGATTYYLRSDNVWDTTYATITKIYDTYNVYVTQTVNIPLGPKTTPAITAQGKISVKLIAQSGSVGGYVRNIILTQGASEIQDATITRTISSAGQTSKSIELYYGLNYPLVGQYEVMNNEGMLTNSTGTRLINWYRYGRAAEAFYSLPFLIMRQYSNLLNKNIATLEGNLGNYNSPVGMISLDKVYTISDTSTNSLTYTAKKFMANRLTNLPYIDQTDSMQFIEISDTDIASTETLVYIQDQELETPTRYF